MNKLSRRTVVALFGATSIAGCLGIGSPLSSNSGREPPDGIPVAGCDTPPSWPTATGPAKRTGQTDIAFRAEPRSNELGGTDDRVFGQTWVVASNDHVFWLQDKETTIRRTHTETGNTDTLSLDHASRVSPTLACGRLAVHTYAGVSWVDAETLEVVGTTPTASPHVSALADDRLVYVSGFNDGLQAYGADTGEPEWHLSIDHFVTGLSSAQHTAYVVDASADGGEVLSVDTQTGEVQWQTDVVGESYTNPVVGADVYTFDNDGTVHALDTDNGEQMWELTTEMTSPETTPAYRDGTVYVADDASGTVTALDAETGERHWQTEIPRGDTDGRPTGTLTSPVCTPEFVLIGASPGGLAVLRRDTGERRWQNSTYSFSSNLAVTEDAVYAVATDGIVELKP